MRILLYIFLLGFLFEDCLAVNYKFSYDEHCRKAYQHYAALHLDEGNVAIRRAIVADPYNLMPVYIADYEDCLLLLFNGDPNDLAQRRAHMNERLELLDKSDGKSPWYRLCKAGIYLHWSLVNVRFGENLKAATTFRKSFLLLKENSRLFPGFDYNNIFFGLEEAVIGTVPGDYQWLVNIFGMKGSVKKGMGKLADFIKKHNANDLLYSEAVLFHSYLRFYLLSEQQEAWNFISSNRFPVDGNLLNLFLRANLAINYRKADVALRILNVARQDPAYSKFPIMDYEMASALFFKLDASAITYYKVFIDKFKGRLFVKDAYQKMALWYYLHDNLELSRANRNQIKRVGSLQVDADKQAERFAENDEWPDKTLLRARVLIDGGYYKQALAMLESLSLNSFSNVADKAEFSFRFGRALDELGNDKAALKQYETAIKIGRNRKEHFAARASLQSAFIHEKNGDYYKAISLFKNCLSMRGHDYQNSIDQQAKAGLNRLGQ
jgi:hypothetical protein